MMYLLAILAGAVAGFINTLAGSGSLITLPMLMFMGLDASTANGTNRVGVLLGTLVAVGTFSKQGKLPLEKATSWMIVPAVVSGVIGAILAAKLDAPTMHNVISIVMILMLFVIMVKPKRWLIESTESQPPLARWTTVLIFSVIGFYGGFIQAGVGIFLLGGLVLHAKYDLVRANALKIFIALMFTAPALCIFIWHDQVHWGFGALIATGQTFGYWAGARFATGHPNANVWIRRVLIFIVILSIVKLLGVDRLLA